MDVQLVESIVRRILDRQAEAAPRMVMAGVSNRHVHLCREHVDALFGAGYELNVQKMLRQPGEFASKETVNVVTYGGTISGVRVLGPVRTRSQFELSPSDARVLKIKPPMVKSGSSVKGPSVTLVGPAGTVLLDQGVCFAWRHVHLSPAEAAPLGLKDGDTASVEVLGERSVVFQNVWIRVNPNFLSEFHVDTDEANGCGLNSGDMVRICV